MRLAISKNSFHYKYYIVLQKIWGLDCSRDKSTSLCLYSQAMFWLTIGTVLISPFLIVGWLILKLGRLLYKILSWTPIGRFVIDILDEVFDLGYHIEKISDKMIDSPVSELFKTSIIGSFIIILSVSVPAALIMGWKLILLALFYYIPIHLMGVIYSLGLALFYVNCFLGLLLLGAVSYTWLGITIAFSYLMGSGFYLTIIGSCLIVGSLVAVLLIKMALSLDKVAQFIEFKINGFEASKRENERRREEEKERQEELRFQKREMLYQLKRKKKNGEIEYTKLEKTLISINSGICKSFSLIGGVLKNSLAGKTTKVKNGSVKVIGIIPMLWQVLISIKDGVCPFVEFIDDEDKDV